MMMVNVTQTEAPCKITSWGISDTKIGEESFQTIYIYFLQCSTLC